MIRTQLPRTLGGGWERSTPWFLPCLLDRIEDRIERSTAENARQRQRTFYPLVSSKAQKSRRATSRLPRTLNKDRERPIPWFLFDSFAPRSGVGSESQSQRFGMLTDKRSEVFLERLSFYTEKILCSRISGISRFRQSSLREANNAERGFSERDADWRRSCLFVRGFLELLNGRDISDAQCR